MAEEEKRYYAFFLNAGNNISLSVTQAGKLTFLWSQEIVKIKSSDFTTLQMIGKGNTIELFVNNEPVHTVTDTIHGSGDPGVIALSVGKYLFDDFAIYQRVG